MDQEGRREDIAEKSEPGDNGRERVRLRADVEELYLEHVAGLRALHEDRPRERMDRARLHARYVGLGGGWPELPVDAVARVEDDFLAFFDRDDRREVGIEPVVSRPRLVSQTSLPVDLDVLHGVITISRYSSGTRSASRLCPKNHFVLALSTSPQTSSP